ncbi:hypothetical protein niasHS_003922 [Heterodera schachtii]|uniref:Uncharacterized protein n=1 Tax=Heterodera schachtii TaxID=97005 RepID=A0ABD2K3U2_HETSC
MMMGLSSLKRHFPPVLKWAQTEGALSLPPVKNPSLPRHPPPHPPQEIPLFRTGTSKAKTEKERDMYLNDENEWEKVKKIEKKGMIGQKKKTAPTERDKGKAEGGGENDDDR